MLGITRLSSKYVENSSPNDWPSSHNNFKAVDGLLRCKICNDFITLAEMLQHCSHTFCSSCIHHWLSLQNSCPSCGIEAKETDLVYNRIVDEILKHFHRIRFSLLGPADKENDPNQIESKQKLELRSPENKMCKNNFAKLKSPSHLIRSNQSTRHVDEGLVKPGFDTVKSMTPNNNNKEKSPKQFSRRISKELKALGISPFCKETRSPEHQNIRKRLAHIRNDSLCASDSKVRSRLHHNELLSKRASLTRSRSSEKLSLKSKANQVTGIQTKKRKAEVSGLKESPSDHVPRRSKRISLNLDHSNAETFDHEKNSSKVLSEETIQLADQVRGKRESSKENKLRRLAEQSSGNPEKLIVTIPDGQSVLIKDLRSCKNGGLSGREPDDTKGLQLTPKEDEPEVHSGSGKKERRGSRSGKRKSCLEVRKGKISKISSCDTMKAEENVAENDGDDGSKAEKLQDKTNYSNISDFATSYDSRSDRDTPELLEDASLRSSQTQPQLEYKVMSDEEQYKQHCKKYLGGEISTNIVTFKQTSEMSTTENLKCPTLPPSHNELEQTDPVFSLETNTDTCQETSDRIPGTPVSERNNCNNYTSGPHVDLRNFDSPSPIVRVDRYLERVGVSSSGSVTPTKNGNYSFPLVSQSSPFTFVHQAGSIGLDNEPTETGDSDTEDVLTEINKSIAEFDAEAVIDLSVDNNGLLSDYQDIWPALSLMSSAVSSSQQSCGNGDECGRTRRESELSESGSDLSRASEMSDIIPLSQDLQNSQSCDVENECPSVQKQENDFVKKSEKLRTRPTARSKSCKRLRSFSLEKRASKRLKTVH